ncbi:MAG: T9SS type A sorting domain-containing protein [Bacteroidales bacterium]|nr:T9SS type A sorting domain-containing protein [Bacteroidales bacterium]
MRNITYLVVGLAVVLIAGLLFFVKSVNTGEDPRVAYEKFINETQEALPVLGVDKIKTLPKMDRPDMAGYADFLKTVDPAIKTVPNWRTTEAYDAIRNNPSAFKSVQDELSWTAHPTDMGGRTRVVMFDPNDPTHSKIWAGSVTGGLWYSDDAINGDPWQPVDDFYSNLSISSLTYDPNNTSTFYAGTGESQTALFIYRESSGRGSGLFKSTNAGQSWELIPSTADWAYVTDVVVRDEDGTSVIYAGVISGLYKGKLHESGPSDGLYRSSDGGTSWTQVLPLVPSGNRPYAPSDIELNADKGRIFIGTTYHWDDREGAACVLYSDNGTDWTLMDNYYNEILSESSNKFPGRVMLAHAPSNPDMVFAAIASGYVRSDQFIGYDCNYLIKTTNNGQNWEEINLPSGFAYLAWHALSIEVSPLNPNMIWLGGLDSWRTTNGGDNWTKLSVWSRMYGNGSDDYVHADIHMFTFKPGSDTDMVIATDGGIFATKSAPATTPVFIELNRGYSTLQYYSCAIHPEAGAIHFMGGLQDNGTMFYKRGKTPTFRDMLSGGDGALCFIDEDNPVIHLTTVYHNSIYLWNAQKEADPVQKRGKSLGSGMFVNAMDYNSRDNVLYANRMKEQGTYPNQIEVIGITENNITNSPRSLATNIQVPYSHVKYSPHSPQGQSTLFLGSLAGHIFKQEDAVHTGQLTNLTPENFPTGNISCIDIGQSEDTLLVTFSNYGVESVWFTTDGGQNWMSKESNLPDIPVRWALIHPQHGIEVMLATELGIWTTTNILANPVVWTQNISGMANVRVDMINMRKSDNTVLAATHGRGMFTTIWNPEQLSSVFFDELQSGISIFPNPSNGVFQVEFSADDKTELVITDLTGRVIIHEKYESGESLISKSINMRDQPKGLYLVSLYTASETKVSKLLIQ